MGQHQCPQDAALCVVNALGPGNLAQDNASYIATVFSPHGGGKRKGVPCYG
ncbi:MAG: hypothetical protein QF677_04710 [Arenicellales bacterium]|nr:hypothetical protein [Arenicellales bacterium]